MTIQSKIEAYETSKTVAEEKQKEADEAVLASRKVLEDIFNEFGEGPHTFAGKSCKIINRRGTFCLFDMSVKRGKGKK